MLRFTSSILVQILALGIIPLTAHAQTDAYPGARYLSPYSASLGGTTLGLSHEIGNSLFNNPAALSRNTQFKAEFLNLDLDANSGTLSGLGMSSLKMSSLGGLTTSLNENPNKVYSTGFSNLTAVSWGGLGVGILYQNRTRAYSDGTTVHYQTLHNMIPTVGYGIALARGVVRLGYSFQYVNEASGVASANSDSSASFTDGISQGHGYSQNLSVNFVFPFTYIPTFSLMARNIGNLHFTSGSLMTGANNPIGTPADVPMSIEAAFGMMVRLSGSLKSHWYLQYKDVTDTAHMPLLERTSLGVDLDLSESVELRGGYNGSQFSGGIGYKTDQSEIGLAFYHERSPFAAIDYWDTRYALQYKIFFQDHNSRNREAETRGR